MLRRLDSDHPGKTPRQDSRKESHASVEIESELPGNAIGHNSDKFIYKKPVYLEKTTGTHSVASLLCCIHHCRFSQSCYRSWFKGLIWHGLREDCNTFYLRQNAI